MKDINEVKEFFQKDIYAYETTGIDIVDAKPTYSKVKLKIDRRHLNANNFLMGAVYYTMADYAFAIANNYDFENSKVVTLQASISYQSSPKTEEIYAECNLQKDGRTTSFYETKITDGMDRLLATVTSVGYKK
ncbi:MAG: PaaI family thioesterase [Lachnospiraceae bacterium]|nr:PaaI family thioesterase [Lachnospiraceae bacterium]